jgi:hypothetical protein
MNRFILTLLATLAVTATAAAQAPPRFESAAVHAWRADLAVLRAEMPVRHGNLFHTMTRGQFDSALASIEQRLPVLTRAQVIVELMRLAALVGDGHSSVTPWRDTAAGFRELPVSFYWFEDGLYVRAATAEHAALVGSRVLAIGGLPPESALARLRPLISHDNEMGTRAWAPVLLAMPEVLQAVGLTADPAHVPLTVEIDGRRVGVTLAPAGPFPMLSGETDRTWMARDGWVDARGRAQPLWLSDPANAYWFSYLPDTQSWYCQINAIQQKPDDPVAAFMTRAIAAADSAHAERFVLDLRLNGGGNGFWNRAILLALIKSRYDAPGKLFVITGRRTWSAAEMLIDEIETYTNAVFVGEPSASRGNVYGDSHRILLPNSHVTVRVSTLYWQLWDPRDTRPWIAPGISAPLTMAAYVAGRDPALEAATRR